MSKRKGRQKVRITRGSYTSLLIEALGKKCANCGTTKKDLDYEIDHITPLWKGGKHTLENVQVLCSSCHAQKTFEEGIPGAANLGRYDTAGAPLRIPLGGLTDAEQEAFDLATKPPFKTYAEIARVLGIKEDAVKQRMSGLAARYARAKSLCNKYEAGTRVRRRLRRGLEP